GQVMDYTDAMAKAMRADDVMISKLAGLTTFEALASRLPIIADTTTPQMPQESRTADLIARHQDGLFLRRASDIVPVVRELIHNPAEHTALKLGAAHLAIPDAT